MERIFSVESGESGVDFEEPDFSGEEEHEAAEFNWEEEEAVRKGKPRCPQPQEEEQKDGVLAQN